MTKPRSYQTEAVIIRKTKLGEADRILTMYTPQLGKIQGFAKSIRRTKSKLAGHLEMLTYSQVSLARGKGIDTITGGQTINSFMPLKSNLEKTSYALYAAELINQFTPEGMENQLLFQLMVDTLTALCEEGDDELIMRHFELHLLDTSGYRPQLRHCVACRAKLEEITNGFSPTSGGILCASCYRKSPYCLSVSVNALKVLRFLQDNGHKNARRLKMTPNLHRELEEILRSHIKFLLEKDLKSVAWLDTLRAQTGLS